MKNNKQLYLILTAVVFILYGQTLLYDYVLDDNLVYVFNTFVQKGIGGIGDIFSNGYVTGFTGQPDQSYRPLVSLSFALEHSLFGDNPFIGHLINMLLYVLSAILLLKLYQLLFPKWNSSLLMLMVLVFIAHPIHTEVVANIKSRDEILHFLFSISALYLIIKHIKTSVLKYLLYALTLYFFALLCKEMAVTFLAVIPITAYFFTNYDWKRIMKVTGYFFLTFLLYFGIRLLVLETVSTDSQMGILNNALLAAPNEIVRLTSCIYILVKYIGLLFIPISLSWDYSFSQIPLVGLGELRGILSFLVISSLLIIAALGLRKKTYFAWSILIFFICISIVSNIVVSIGSTMGERFLFTPSIVMPLVLLLALSKVLKVDVEKEQMLWSRPIVLILGTVFVLFSMKTIDRNQVWENDETLFLSGIKSAPNSTRTWMALGSHYRKLAEESTDQLSALSNYQSAIQNYNKATQILPENFDAWYNLGVSYNRISKPEEAKFAYKKTIEYSKQNENAWNNLGTIFFNEKKYEESRKHFQKVFDLNPLHLDAVKNMASSYYNESRFEEAAIWYEKAYLIAPNNPQIIQLLIRTYSNLGNVDKVSRYQMLLKATQ